MAKRDSLFCPHCNNELKTNIVNGVPVTFCRAFDCDYIVGEGDVLPLSYLQYLRLLSGSYQRIIDMYAIKLHDVSLAIDAELALTDDPF